MRDRCLAERVGWIGAAPAGLFRQLLERVLMGRLPHALAQLMAHDVARDAIQPRARRGIPRERGGTTPRRDERLLQRIVEVDTIGRAGHKKPMHGRLMRGHELLEGPRISRGGVAQECAVLTHGRFGTPQVEKPSIVYSGHDPMAAVSSGMKPR
jgi:hypothetical protein